MARSTNVYVVRNLDRYLLAAFTVKHELATWLYRGGHRDVIVHRVEDGPRGGVESKVTEMEVSPLLWQGYQQSLYWWNRTLPEFRSGECPEPPNETTQTT